jgi:23S rRNA pseudouridine2605 synthase
MHTPERIQKALAQEGLGSRREIERLILDGLIKVNGKPATIGQKITFNDKIKFKDKVIKLGEKQESKQMLLYHKPVGEICSTVPEKDLITVFDHLPKLYHSRWVMVGRLDVNTSGLLLFTNDGELAHKYMHPSFEQKRVYLVRAFGEVDLLILQQLRKGAELDGQMCKFESLDYKPGTNKNHTFTVVLREGKYREVRRLFESVGLTVSRLKRVQYGQYTLPRELRPGEFKKLILSLS